MGFIVFYLIGCIIAYMFNKDNISIDNLNENKSKYIPVLLSWITVAKYIYDNYLSQKL